MASPRTLIYANRILSQSKQKKKHNELWDEMMSLVNRMENCVMLGYKILVALDYKNTHSSTSMKSELSDVLQLFS